MATDFRISKLRLQNLTEEEIFWTLIEPIWPDSSVIDELDRVRCGTPGQRTLFTTTLFMREVDNGGLFQFFWNSSGIYAEFVLEGFKLLNAKNHFTVLENALKIFNNNLPNYPIDTDERRVFLNSFDKEDLKKYFEPLEEQIFDESKLYPLFTDYIKDNPTEFFYD